MKLVRRIVVTVVVTLAVVFVGVNWVVPVALSFYAAKKAPAVTSVVPTDLKDKTISVAPGTRLSYFGYEFEVPWTDIDDTKTKFYPKDKPEKSKVELHFHSGLRLLISSLPPKVWANQLSREFSVSAQNLESLFGHETMKSDYSFVQTLYEFSPDKMDHWAGLQRGLNKGEILLMIKSVALPKAAETGIFNIQNQNYKGFQEGNPRVRQAEIVVDLYSDEGDIEMLFLQEDYRDYRGVTQPEINRIVQSLRKAPQDESTTAQIAQK